MITALAILFAGALAVAFGIQLRLVSAKEQLIAAQEQLLESYKRLDACSAKIERIQEQRYQVLCALNSNYALQLLQIRAANEAMANFIREQNWHPPDDADSWKRG